jgi:hypothetical protein
MDRVEERGSSYNPNEMISTLCAWRRTNAERKNDARSLMDGVRRNEKHRTGKDGRGLIGYGGNYAGMRHRANRALVTRELGVVGVNVDRLGKAAETDQQHADQA